MPVRCLLLRTLPSLKNCMWMMKIAISTTPTSIPNKSTASQYNAVASEIRLECKSPKVLHPQRWSPSPKALRSQCCQHNVQEAYHSGESQRRCHGKCKIEGLGIQALSETFSSPSPCSPPNLFHSSRTTLPTCTLVLQELI